MSNVESEDDLLHSLLIEIFTRSKSSLQHYKDINKNIKMNNVKNEDNKNIYFNAYHSKTYS